MADQRSDYRWRDRERSGSGRDYGRDERDRWSRDDDRGFWERAGDEMRSWFGDEEAARRREMDQRNWERERGWESGAGRDYGSERFDEGRYNGSTSSYAGGPGPDIGGGSGFSGPYAQGRRFDRIDAGSTGTHGAHPMSAPATGSYSPQYGITPEGGYRRSSYGATSGGSTGGRRYDPHYHEWRNRQIDALDRDYDEYRREHQSQFDREFGSWREKRQTQRQALGRVREHMEVVGSDGQHIGTVDTVREDRVVLTRSDPSAGGHHHSIPCGWIERVDDKVTINKTADEARNAWRDEETSRALFEREDQGSEGPHILGRSFSGTY